MFIKVIILFLTMEIKHRYFELLVSLCTENLWNDVYRISVNNCSGCEIAHPSQTEHSCLMDSSYMKLIVNFEIAFMSVNVRESLQHMLKEYECEREGVKSLWSIMKGYSLTDFWKNELFSRMEQQAKSRE